MKTTLIDKVTQVREIKSGYEVWGFHDGAWSIVNDYKKDKAKAFAEAHYLAGTQCDHDFEVTGDNRDWAFDEVRLIQYEQECTYCGLCELVRV